MTLLTADFTIKQGDLLPAISASLTDSTGAAVDLTGASAAFVLRSSTAAAPVVNAAATVTAATAGKVSYSWATGNTGTAGDYQAEWIITFPGGGKQTFPSVGYTSVSIQENLSTSSSYGRLVSLGDLTRYLQIPSGDKTQQGLLLTFMDSATQVIEYITGPLTATQVERVFNGGGESILLPHKYVQSIQQVFENRGLTNYILTEQPLGQSTDAFGYTWDRSINKIVRRGFGGGVTLFPPGVDNVVVSYTAGVSVIPANVVQATLELIKHWWQLGQQGNRAPFGAPADAASDETGAVIAGFAVPNRVIELLKPTKRTPGLG